MPCMQYYPLKFIVYIKCMYIANSLSKERLALTGIHFLYPNPKCRYGYVMGLSSPAKFATNLVLSRNISKVRILIANSSIP